MMVGAQSNECRRLESVRETHPSIDRRERASPIPIRILSKRSGGYWCNRPSPLKISQAVLRLMREGEECDSGCSGSPSIWQALCYNPRPEGNHGHHLAIERREGEDCWTIECAGYCYHSSERIRSPRRITRTSQDEPIGASEDFCCTESALGKNKGPQGCPDQSRQATYFSSGISEYQSGN